MTKEEYVKENTYKYSRELIISFRDTVLCGEIDRLAGYCFEDLKQYMGKGNDKQKYVIPSDESRGKQKDNRWEFDSDDTALARACYCVLWGHLFNIGVGENYIGSRTLDQHKTAPYRGDTMNSFKSVFGKTGDIEKMMPHRIRMYELDKDIQIVTKVRDFYKLYHTLGNMILIPNRGNGKAAADGINNRRAAYPNGLRDYFDYFLMILYECQKKDGKIDKRILARGKAVYDLMKKEGPNQEYTSIDITEWKEEFALEDYFEGDIPKNILNCKDVNIDRFKITRFPEKYRTDYTKDEYKVLVEAYIDVCKGIIEKRSNKLVQRIKDELKPD